MEEEHHTAVSKIIKSFKDDENSNEQYVDLNLSLGRFPSENYSTNEGKYIMKSCLATTVGNAYILGSSLPSSSIHEYDFFASNSQARDEKKIHEYDFMGLASANLVSTNLSLTLETPMNMMDFSDTNPICQSILSRNLSRDYAREIASANPMIENTVPVYDISSMKSLSGSTSNMGNEYIPFLLEQPLEQGSLVSWDFSYPSSRFSETSVSQPSSIASSLSPWAPRNQATSSSSAVEKNLQVDHESSLGTIIKTNYNKKLSIDIPKVVTNGGNPNGTVIEGYLYKYDDGEVLILCGCHKSVFTPREFVMHGGGGGDVENPNSLIKVVGYY